MLDIPHYACDDPDVVRDLIRENPWAILVSDSPDGAIASHYPILLDEHNGELAILTHVGRPDDELHAFGEREILLIVQGAHGYVSPSWYSEEAGRVPTWDFAVAHCYGVPEILSLDRNIESLRRLVEHFERHVERPTPLSDHDAATLAPHTVGLRIPITRFQCKIKMSQDKDRASQQQVVHALDAPGAYHNPRLAKQIRLVNQLDPQPDTPPGQ